IPKITPGAGGARPATEVEIGAEVTGRILEIHADFNDPVSAGDLLARIDPAPFESAVAQARAQLAAREAAARSAAANLDDARAQAARLERLAASAAGRQADLESAQFRVRIVEADLQSAQANTELAREALRRAEIDLERTEIRSPVDGFVLDRRVEQGQAVNALQSAPTVFVVASNLDRMLIEASVPEADINRIEESMTVRATVDASPGRPFPGAIQAIRRAPVRQGRFVSYVVLVEADNRMSQLLPGMTASVEFIRAEARAVLRVPVDSLYFRPRGFTPDIPPETIANFERQTGRTLPADQDMREAALMGMDAGNLARQGLRRVFVLVDGAPEAREIRVGGEDQTHIEVIEGLEEGEEVITGHAR
ncbi:MAG: efflux RND transporter periplasmic adaptor subunit, partial [Oceanicaulis sp.]|nr:efflux RND transporter periplasmic adaptor subunit [Oceanicaulis sp.]